MITKLIQAAVAEAIKAERPLTVVSRLEAKSPDITMR